MKSKKKMKHDSMISAAENERPFSFSRSYLLPAPPRAPSPDPHKLSFIVAKDGIHNNNLNHHHYNDNHTKHEANDSDPPPKIGF